MTNEQLLAYTAGLIDGEGSILCLGQGPQRPHQPEVSIGMTTPECLVPLQQEFGGFIRESRREPPRQTMYVWRVKGAAARGLLVRTRKYLVIPRRQAAAHVLLEEWPSSPNRQDPGAVQHYREATAAIARRLKPLTASRSESASYDPRVARDADLAYLAGILDGEGHIQEGGGFDVWSTDPELVAWLNSLWPGRVSSRAAKGNRRKLHRWYLRPSVARELPVASLMRHKKKLERIRTAAGGSQESWIFEYLPAVPLAVAEASGRSFPVVYTELARLEKLGLVRKARKIPTRRAGRDPWEYEGTV